MSADDMLARADRLAALNMYEEAGEVYKQAVRARLPGAAVKYGEMLFLTGDYPAAERVLRAAVADGEKAAIGWLSDTLVADQRPGEAAHLMEWAAAQGVPVAALRAATIWADAVGDREKAEEWYKKAIERGEPGAVNDYGSFLSEDDSRLEEAERVLRQAAEQGDALAFSNLGGAAIENDDEGALYYYAVFLSEEGRVDEAMNYYLRAIDAGSDGAYEDVALIYQEHGEAEAAEEYFKASITAGWLSAVFSYADLLRGEGRASEIEALIPRAESLGAAPEQVEALREHLKEEG
ncbi:Tfp pilus assembly protein PilF [Streptosporangium album]|uniref:Tfp pilus assembly protein PilF n=1 Tax=Streptosporangium album TaxID=47479 RepID=A0A7W7RU55_9ACTN|nr:hypothetical protein [Streptosporangium album]MBB4937972.1 Tfp pilus assembly protein PilF [Streptosporangium album]